MIEIIVGLVLCYVVWIGVRIYMRWFVREGPRNDDFERWCRSEPVVAALRVDEDAHRDVIDALRHLLAPGRFRNRAGRFPWQHYAVRFEWKRLPDGVVGIVITGCARERVREHHQDIADALRGLGRELGERIDELWVHGELHGAEHRFPRAKVGWIGRFAEDGSLEVRPMIGHPEWLRGPAKAA